MIFRRVATKGKVFGHSLLLVPQYLPLLPPPCGVPLWPCPRPPGSSSSHRLSSFSAWPSPGSLDSVPAPQSFPSSSGDNMFWQPQWNFDCTPHSDVVFLVIRPIILSVWIQRFFAGYCKLHHLLYTVCLGLYFLNYKKEDCSCTFVMLFMMKLGLDGNIFISSLDFFPDFKIPSLTCIG